MPFCKGSSVRIMVSCPVPPAVLHRPEPTQIINESGYGYKQNGAAISHLFYVDDIQLYANNERDVDSQIHFTRIYRNYIRISFKLDKCG